MDHLLITQQSIGSVGVRLAKVWLGQSHAGLSHKETRPRGAVAEQAEIPWLLPAQKRLRIHDFCIGSVEGREGGVVDIGGGRSRSAGDPRPRGEGSR